MSLADYLCFGSAYPFGATPQTPREFLGAQPHFAGNEAPQSGRILPHLTAFFDKAKGRGTHIHHGPPFCRASVSCLLPSYSRGAWGVAPNGGRRRACALWALARSAKRTVGVNRNEQWARQCTPRRLRLREPKRNGTNKLMVPLGRSPNKGMQGTMSPAGVWGGTPTSPSPTLHGFADSLRNRKRNYPLPVSAFTD